MIWLYLIAFLIGFDAATSATQTLLNKDFFTLNAAQWASVSVLFGLPWSCKVPYSMVISSTRLNWVALGGILMTLSQGLYISLLNGYFSNLHFGILSICAFIYSSGMVISDIILDTKIIDLNEGSDERLGRSAIWHRAFMVLGGLTASLITAWLTKFNPVNVMFISFLFPLGVILSSFWAQKTDKGIVQTLDRSLKLLGIGFCILGAVCLFTGQQLLFITLTMIFLYIYATKYVTLTKPFVMACIAVFCFRVIPGTGQAFNWWLLNGLQAPVEYLGHLAIASNIFTIVGLAAVSRVVVRAPLAKSLILLTLLDVLLNVPSLLVYYFGYNYQYTLLFEAGATSMLGSVAMIPLHILLSKSAPKENRVIYVAASASFVNVALSIGSLISKWLAEVFPVTPQSFDNMGLLMLSCLGVSLLFSIGGILCLKKS